MNFVTRARALQTAVVGSLFMVMASPSFAVGGTSFDAFIDEVDLSGLAVKVIAAGLLIIGIAIAFKGADLGKRVVRKV